MVNSLSRPVVYWFGSLPSPAQKREFKNRGMELRAIASEPLAKLDFSIARGVVFAVNLALLPQVRRRLPKLLPLALDHGLMVYLLAADDTLQGKLTSYVSGIPSCVLNAQIRRRTGRTPPYELPEAIARHEPGNAANPDLRIERSKGVRIGRQERFLLSRAFSDCSSITLAQLSGGRSARAFMVHATLRNSLAGPRPLPFFAKLDTPDKILDEKDCYQNYATYHIPWYLRPNLDAGRCFTGVARGVLVGAFVEYSESLWEAVRKGRGPRHIHALFEDTLMSWRSQAHGKPLRVGSLAGAFKNVYRPGRVKPEYLRIAGRFGTVLPPAQLEKMLLELPDQSWREAPMHGDMHGENVRVRNNDAIVIDLARTTSGPLSGDLASLDVWLSFECPKKDSLMPPRKIWTKLVRHLYAPINLIRLQDFEGRELGLEWLRGCIRQIRMIAGAAVESSTEYQTAVAVYLLRWATFKPDSEEDKYRRGFAYYLGDKLVQGLSKTMTRSTDGLRP